jgi:hypothetical protein
VSVCRHWLRGKHTSAVSTLSFEWAITGIPCTLVSEEAKDQRIDRLWCPVMDIR